VTGILCGFHKSPKTEKPVLSETAR